MIGTTRAYLDPSGGVRLYIPRDIVSELGWANHDRLILKQHDGKLKIYPEKDHEVPDDDEHLQEQEVEA
jgi:hypothetical protein